MTSVASQSPYMTRAEAGDYLRCSIGTVDRNCIKYKWRVSKTGAGRILILKKDVLAFVQPTYQPGRPRTLIEV